MLGQVIGVEARALVELDQAQPLVELPAEIGAAPRSMWSKTPNFIRFPRFRRCYKVCMKKYLCLPDRERRS